MFIYSVGQIRRDCLKQFVKGIQYRVVFYRFIVLGGSEGAASFAKPTEGFGIAIPP